MKKIEHERRYQVRLNSGDMTPPIYKSFGEARGALWQARDSAEPTLSRDRRRIYFATLIYDGDKLIGETEKNLTLD